jgi:hypothetical protein
VASVLLEVEILRRFETLETAWFKCTPPLLSDWSVAGREAVIRSSPPRRSLALLRACLALWAIATKVPLLTGCSAYEHRVDPHYRSWVCCRPCCSTASVVLPVSRDLSPCLLFACRGGGLGGGRGCGSGRGALCHGRGRGQPRSENFLGRAFGSFALTLAAICLRLAGLPMTPCISSDAISAAPLPNGPSTVLSSQARRYQQCLVRHEAHRSP